MNELETGFTIYCIIGVICYVIFSLTDPMGDYDGDSPWTTGYIPWFMFSTMWPIFLIVGAIILGLNLIVKMTEGSLDLFQ